MLRHYCIKCCGTLLGCFLQAVAFLYRLKDGIQIHATVGSEDKAQYLMNDLVIPQNRKLTGRIPLCG